MVYMQVDKQKLITSTAWVASLGIAWYAARLTGPSSTEPTASGALPSTQESPARATSPGAASPASAEGKPPAGDAAGLRGLFTAAPTHPEDVARRVQDILAMDEPAEKMAAWLEFIGSLKTDAQLAAAMQELTGTRFDGRERGREFGLLMDRWAAVNPLSALTWAQGQTDWRGGWASFTGLKRWAKTDPEKALAWAQANPAKGRDNYGMAGLVEGLARKNLDKAAEVASTMERSDARGEAIDSVIDQFYKQRSADDARRWVESLPDTTYRVGAASRLAARMAQGDAAQAAAWAAQLPQGEAKTRAYTEVIDVWANKNPNDAGNWLNSLPYTADTDEPRERFAWNVSRKDPESAITWAGTITNLKKREEVSMRLAREWIRREPDAARAWVERSGLTPEAKQRLLNQKG